jgi:hypothetical protein
MPYLTDVGLTITGLFAWCRYAMKKNYFPHDLYARNDIKKIKLKMEMGDEGIGIYWQLIEMLYENEGVMRTEYDCIANVMRTQCDLIIAVITKYDLFVVTDTEFYSKSVLKRIEVMNEKSKKAKESALIGWEKRRK